MEMGQVSYRAARYLSSPDDGVRVGVRGEKVATAEGMRAEEWRTRCRAAAGLLSADLRICIGTFNTQQYRGLHSPQ